MSFRIAKAYDFDASHHLPGLPDGHKCGRVHGHTWRVEVTLAADELRAPGFVTDFGDLRPFGKYVADHFDHRDLNKVVSFPPTSELLAEHFGKWVVENLVPHVSGRLDRVRVWESATSWAEYTPDPS